jgi:hypothetical protein
MAYWFYFFDRCGRILFGLGEIAALIFKVRNFELNGQMKYQTGA